MNDATLEVTWLPGGRVTTRSIILALDGEEIGELPQGHTLRLQVAPGKHHLRAHNRLYQSDAEFSVSAGQTIRFLTGMKAAGCFVPLVMLGAAALTVFLEQAEVG